MKIIENVLSEDLFSRCKVECNNKLRLNEWQSSTIFWNTSLREGIDGCTMTTPTSPQIHDEIENELRSHLPPFPNGLMTQYYVWQPNSGIAMHNDNGKRFGATIYLNDTWHPNSGGWFIWKDNPDFPIQEDSRAWHSQKYGQARIAKEWNTYLPERNCMVLNDQEEYHLVTRVAADGYAIRITMQIWGLKE